METRGWGWSRNQRGWKEDGSRGWGTDPRCHGQGSRSIVLPVDQVLDPYATVVLHGVYWRRYSDLRLQVVRPRLSDSVGWCQAPDWPSFQWPVWPWTTVNINWETMETNNSCWTSSSVVSLAIGSLGSATKWNNLENQSTMVRTTVFPSDRWQSNGMRDHRQCGMQQGKNLMQKG